jgi:ribonuclease HI
LVINPPKPTWGPRCTFRPVYYISKVPSDCETCYNQVQKLLYVIIITKCTLLHYFESHLVLVVTSHELGDIIENCLAMGMIAKWPLELMGLDITYVPQIVIKSQALVDFMVEWTETQQLPTPVIRVHWSMYFDGSFTLNRAEGGVVLISPKGDRVHYMIRLHFRATNNVVEYEALINGLGIAIELRV